MKADAARAHPSIFSAWSIGRILDGEKSQTRRLITAENSLVDGNRDRKLFAQLDFTLAIVDPGPSPAGNRGPYLKAPHRNGETTHRVYPLWQRDDLVWIRETFAFTARNKTGLVYRADVGTDRSWARYIQTEPKWRSPIFMRREESRILLQVDDIEPQKVQAASLDDIVAEGLKVHPTGFVSDYEFAREEWRKAWDSINARRCPWKDNPWVWKATFSQVPQ